MDVLGIWDVLQETVIIETEVHDTNYIPEIGEQLHVINCEKSKSLRTEVRSDDGLIIGFLPGVLDYRISGSNFWRPSQCTYSGNHFQRSTYDDEEERETQSLILRVQLTLFMDRREASGFREEFANESVITFLN